jgi:ParB-like chromosome segregation protein Spo0J
VAESLPIEKIYVPVKKRKTLSSEHVREIAESILESAQECPVLVRVDEGRFVLLDGLHRLEACKALGESTILASVVPPQVAENGFSLREFAQAEAQRLKMDRLKQLRLEREAATDTASEHVKSSDQLTQQKARRGAHKSSLSKPKTLSDWIESRQRDGSQY